MSTSLTPFDFTGQQVRVVADEHGEPWFVARDVCAVLDIANGRDAMARLADDEKGVATTDTLGGAQQVTTVSEPGLYRLIFTSRKVEAETFRRWVTHTVIPSIRKTGGYGTPAVPDISTPAGVLAMAEQFAATARQLVAAETKVAELAPKADLADTFLIADGSTRLVREAAKLLAMRERDLRRFLVDEKLLFVKHAPCGQAMYDHYAAHAHHFVVKETPVQHTFGLCSHYTVYVTARGMELIRKRLRGTDTPAVTELATAGAR